MNQEENIKHLHVPSINQRVPNINIIQSYIYTEAKYSYSPLEKRILTEVTLGLQQVIRENLNFKGKTIDLGNVSFHSSPESIRVLVKITRGKYHTTDMIKASKGLMAKTIEWYDKAKKTHKIRAMMEEVDIMENEELGCFMVKFKLSKDLFEIMTNFTKGYRTYDAEVMFKLKSAHAMRLYELISHVKLEKITYTMEKFRELLNCEDKYTTNATLFIQRVVDKAKSELDEKCPFGFNYKLSRDGNNKITHIHLIPYKNVEVEDIATMREETGVQELFLQVPEDFIKYMMTTFEFTEVELYTHVALLDAMTSMYGVKDLIKRIESKRSYIESKKNKKGYVMSIIQGLSE